MNRMPLLQLIVAAALVLLQGPAPAWADATSAAQVESASASAPAQPVRVAWDRVGAVA
ncbi:MAG: hypothetical protein AB1593_05355 [Pseudomonadota bacterium]